MMEKPQPYLVSPFKSKDLYPQKAKGISFFASLLSVFLYISVFYIFNLSPSQLSNDPKFWFLISNTLIFIISVDYGAFSSSEHGVYEDHAMRRQRSGPLFVKRIPEPSETVSDNHEKFQEKKRTGHAHRRIRVPERKRVTINVNPEGGEAKIRSSHSRTLRKRHIEGGGREENKVAPSTKTYVRSKSDVVKRVMFDESKNTVRRVETVKYEPPDYEKEDDCTDDEYANLSTEELNRRVEEFIQRFNQQIRQQKEVY